MNSMFDRENMCIKEGHTVVWRDLVCIRGQVHAESFQIENGVDLDPGEEDAILFRTDDFMNAVAEKYGLDEDEEFTTYMMDGEGFDEEANLPEGFYQSDAVTFGAEDCGAYIDGEPAEFVLYDLTEEDLKAREEEPEEEI